MGGRSSGRGVPPAPRADTLRGLAPGVCRGHRHGRHRPNPPFCPRAGVAAERRPRVTGRIVEGPEQPLLVVPQERHNVSAGLCPKLEDPIDARSRIRSPIDVVAEKDHGVMATQLRYQLFKHRVEGIGVAVDVTDRNRGHRWPPRGVNQPASPRPRLALFTAVLAGLEEAWPDPSMCQTVDWGWGQWGPSAC